MTRRIQTFGEWTCAGHTRWRIGAGIVFAVLLFVLVFLSPSRPVARAASAPPGLVLWNKLGSETEVLTSEVGPNLGFFDANDCNVVDCLVAYLANTIYVPGVFGDALSIGPGDYDGGVSRVHNAVLRNASQYVNPERGTVEAWFMQTASGIPYLYGDYRVFDGAYGFSPGIVFGTNDLEGNGHFVFQYGLQFGGADVETKSLSDGQVGYDISAYNGQWIHVAGVWDRGGIAGTTDTLRLYVNGQVVATATGTGWGTTIGPVVDIGGGNASEIAGKFAVDNLKLWNIAKTDFSDRSSEGVGEPVAVDVEPNHSTNTINLQSHGQVEVAILSNSSFDATSIDPNSVQLGVSGALALPKKNRTRDVNGDKVPDLILSFKLQATGIQTSDTQVCLWGSTLGGIPIFGCDAIQTRS